MRRGEKALNNTCDDEQGNTAENKSDGLSAPLSQCLFSGKIAGRDQGRPEQKPSSARYEYGGEFDNSVRKYKGPKIHIQTVMMAQSGQGSKEQSIEGHDINGTEAKGHAKGEGQKRYGDVVSHYHAGGERTDSQDRVEPNFSSFNLFNKVRGSDERDEAVVNKAC